MAKKAMTQVAVEMFGLLEPLSEDERNRAITATFALLGQPLAAHENGKGLVRQAIENPRYDGEGLKPNTEKWLRQYQITRAAIDNIFHIDGDDVTVIATQVPGGSKRERSINCYLLIGVRNLLAKDEASFTDREAVEYCQQVNAHDAANHAANRSALGPRLTGSRSAGFKLTVPGLRDAAILVKAMTSNINEG
jgi:hypothetical protein